MRLFVSEYCVAVTWFTLHSNPQQYLPHGRSRPSPCCAPAQPADSVIRKSSGHKFILLVQTQLFNMGKYSLKPVRCLLRCTSSGQ
jgi:hypothetical protein